MVAPSAVPRAPLRAAGPPQSEERNAAVLMQEMGLTSAGIERRKAMVGLGAEDIRLVLSMREVLREHSAGNLDAFFAHLERYEGEKRLFRDASLVARARAMKAEHLRAMLDGDYGADYVRQRLELALVYSAGDLDLKVFVGAFHGLMRDLGEQVMAAHLRDPMAGFRAFMALKKVAFFDLTLMTDVLIFQRESTIRRIGQEASQYARSLIESSLDPLVTISPDGKITDVNEATTKVSGVPRDRLIGSDFSDYFTEPEKAREGYKQVFANGFVADYPLTIRHRNGKLTDVLYNASVYKDVQGNVLGVFAAARDVTAQKQASQYARSLIEASLDPLVTISPDGKITDVNEAAAKVTGVPRQRLIGSDFSDYFTEPEKAREGYKQVFAKGFVADYPLTIRHKDGNLTDVLYNASVYKDPRGNVLGVFAAARDVTDQKQASQYARSLVEASLDPLVTISPDGKVTDVNEAATRATGVAREKLIGSDFSDYFTEPEKAREGYKQVFARGFVADYPLTIRHRNGKLTDVLYNASVYKDVRGNVLGVFAAARDVTAQKQASQYARSLVEASLDPLVTISPDGKITDVNEATTKVTGETREKLIGSDFSDYFTEPEKAREGYKQVFARGFVADYPLTIRRKDGHQTHVLYNASVYKDVRGNVLGVFAAARDVTAQKRAEAEVQDQRTRELDRLAELERFQRLTVGRELKMIELKREIAELRRKHGEVEPS